MTAINREMLYASRYLAGQVRRYHTWPTIRRPNVAEHSWRMANIYVEVFGIPRPEVLYWCLNHDCGELWAGDLPYGSKQSVPGLKEAINDSERMGLRRLGLRLPDLTSEEFRRAKVCDLLEMYEFGHQEVMLGNQWGLPIERDALAEAQRLAAAAGASNQVNAWLLRNQSDGQ